MNPVVLSATKMTASENRRLMRLILLNLKFCMTCCLTTKAEPRLRDVNRDSGTAMANRRWLRRLVRPLVSTISNRKAHLPQSPSRLCGTIRAMKSVRDWKDVALDRATNCQPNLSPNATLTVGQIPAATRRPRKPAKRTSRVHKPE